MKSESLYKHLSKFKGWRETLFLLVLVERAFPNYALFAEVVESKIVSDDAEVTGAGNAIAMAEIINRCWELVENKVEDSQEIDNLLIRLGNITPDPEKFDVYGVNPALACCELLDNVLFTWINEDNRRAHTAAMSSLNSVIDFIEYREGDGLDDDALVTLFDSHPLMLEEKSFQEEMFKMIKAERFPSASFINKIREMAGNGGVSNLGISLEDAD